MLISVVLLLFKVEDKKRAWWGGYKFQGSALRSFNWQHCNSYVLCKPTDLFCDAILFAKFNMLASFNLHFFSKYWGSIDPHMLFQWMEQGHSVSPHKIWRNFFQKAFHVRWGTKFWRWQIYWVFVLIIKSWLDHHD